MSPTDERSQILERIRSALKTPAPVPGNTHQERDTAEPHVPDTGEFSEWLPAPGTTQSEWETLFAKNSEMLKTKFVVLASRSELPAALNTIAVNETWSRIAAHRCPLVEEALTKTNPAPLLTDDGYSVDDLEKCDAGISACDALVAQTGSVLVTSRSAGGRALSALPPHHVVIATRDQLLPDLPSAFRFLEEKYAENYPSFIGFITGPSRTGDIERILVLGAHGPKKLTVILVP